MDATFINEQWRKFGVVVAIGPLLVLPAAALSLFVDCAAWQLMWLLAFSIYAGLKWMTFATCDLACNALIGRVLGYLLLWPGMDAQAFLDIKSHGTTPTGNEMLFAICKLGTGLVLMFVVVQGLVDLHPFVAGWIGMIGLVFVLHFGVFHILSVCWRLQGIDATPIMNSPILASSLSDFWGRRWNLAFRDLAFGYVFQRSVRHIGIVGATMADFLVSGAIHDLVISLPSRGGWGGPTVYFLIQGGGLLVERSHSGKRLGLGKGVVGRAFCGLCTIGPVFLLFHEPFVRQVILPTLSSMSAF